MTINAKIKEGIQNRASVRRRINFHLENIFKQREHTGKYPDPPDP